MQYGSAKIYQTIHHFIVAVPHFYSNTFKYLYIIGIGMMFKAYIYIFIVFSANQIAIFRKTSIMWRNYFKIKENTKYQDQILKWIC